MGRRQTDAATAAPETSLRPAHVVHAVPAAARRPYDDARMHARDGRIDASARALLAAVRAGFDDVSRLRRDADLAVLREHEVFRAVVAARDAADSTLTRRRVIAWASRPGYSIKGDPERRLIYVTALDEPAREMIYEHAARHIDVLQSTLFADMPRHQILIIVPDAADASTLLPDKNTNGVYTHRSRQVITRAGDRSMAHELVHALHESHLDEVGLDVPTWYSEGLASLFEHYVASADGRIHFLPNDRDEALAKLLATGRVLPLATAIRLDGPDLSREAYRVYPQLRSFFRFLAEIGSLTAWNDAISAHGGAADPALEALEAVFQAPLVDLDRRWRRWLAR